MRLRTAALLAALLATTAAGAPADATHRKPMSGTYDVLIPVPHPVEDAGTHCNQGVDPLSRASSQVALPDLGELKVKVSGFVGDWVVEIYDAKGRVLAYGATLDLVSGVREAKWRKKKGAAEKVLIFVCNFGGTPRGTVSWSYTFTR